MLEWKGELTEKSGDKARRIDEISGFPVPNFFVITPDEIAKLFEGEKDSRKVKDTELNNNKLREIKEAYSEVDMSSEIRNASGRARNLVGGQRDGSRVSVRVCEDGFQQYQLNVGSSEIQEALRNVVGSHLDRKDEYPSIIVQKMIEPELSGSAIKQGDQVIIEAVKGYGTALEEGMTAPDLYRVGDTIEKKVPDRQIEASLNPMTGDIREKEVKRNAPLLKDAQLRQLAEKVSKEKYSIKFAYKRGTFYAVDAFKSPDISVTAEMDGIKVSPGEIDGKPDSDYVRVSEPSNPKKPMIAAVSGFALGGGCELAMTCDMIVASETAKFGQPEIKIGVMPGAGGTQRLTRAVGKARAMEMVLTGKFITAEEARHYGLINKVVPVALYLTEAVRLAQEVAAMSPVAAQLAKESVNEAFNTSLDEGLKFERKNFYLLFASEDQNEGMEAFVEKRKPKFKGK
jgi:hypothetical protein